MKIRMPDEPCVISLATDGADLYAGTELASVAETALTPALRR